MGGDLQPFYAQRKIDAKSAMTSNHYAAPVDSTEKDAALAVQLASADRAARGPQGGHRRTASAYETASPDPYSYNMQGANPARHNTADALAAATHRRSKSASIQNPPQQMQMPVPADQSTAFQPDASIYVQHYQTAPANGVAMAMTAPAASSHSQNMPRHTAEINNGGSKPSGAPRLTADKYEMPPGGGALPPYQSPYQPPLRPHGPPPVRTSELWRIGSGEQWDQQIGRQMSGAVPISHTPRVNNTQASPPESPEVSRRRLESRLKMFGLVERKCKGDGSCQFRAVADQLYRNTDLHLEVRRVCVHHLRSNPESYAKFVPGDFWKYVFEMEQPGTWGDHVTLQAIADAYGLRLNILTSYPDSSFITITPAAAHSHRVLYLSFWAEVHYQSIYPANDPPKSEKVMGSKKLYRLMHPSAPKVTAAA